MSETENQDEQEMLSAQRCASFAFDDQMLDAPNALTILRFFIRPHCSSFFFVELILQSKNQQWLKLRLLDALVCCRRHY